MSWLHNRKYHKFDLFPPSMLADINPMHIMRFLNYRAYGTPDPVEGTKPKERSESIAHYKVCISHYMPNKYAQWNQSSTPPSGNPTKSMEANSVIAGLRLLESRGLGVASKEMRPLKVEEFRLLQQLSRDTCRNLAGSFIYPTIMKHQFHFICRSDDCSHFKTNDLMAHPRFDFALMQKVKWSKNVREAQGCPDQILLGAMDVGFCVLLGLATYLEYTMTLSGGTASELLYTTHDDANAAARLNRNFKTHYRKLKHHREFVAVKRKYGGDIGAHSTRKLATTYAMMNGRNSLHEAEVRGRWKRHKGNKVSRRYVDIEQQFIDAKVGGSLCVGGPVKYKLVPHSGITDDWLLHNVVPHIANHFTNSNLPLVLALPLLWACMEGESGAMYQGEHVVPDSLREKIRTAYLQVVNDLPAGVNPVKKVSTTCFVVTFMRPQITNDFFGARFFLTFTRWSMSSSLMNWWWMPVAMKHSNRLSSSSNVG